MGRRSTQVAETRSRVVAAELFAQRGARATTMTEVARLADVSTATVTNHFATQDLLIEAVVAHLMALIRVPGEEIFAGRKSAPARLKALTEAMPAASQNGGGPDPPGDHERNAVGWHVSGRSVRCCRRLPGPPGTQESGLTASAMLWMVSRLRLRVLLAIGAAAVVVATLVVVVPRLLPPGPRPLFQLPVACGETWQLSTYPGHDDFDSDMYPKQGTAWGRPVLASFAGTVTEAGINGTLGGRTPETPNGPRGRGGGYLVKIDHGGKWQSQYLHLLEKPLVQVGQRVTQGEQIGKVGSTGNSGAPHLHYEQRRAHEKVESYFDGKPSGITHDDVEYTVELKSNNCSPPAV